MGFRSPSWASNRFSLYQQKGKGNQTSDQATTMVRGCPALVLAAGASKRLGQPKALVEVGSTTLVGLAVQRLLDAGCAPVVVVTRQSLHFEVMKEALNATVVVNKEPEKGRTGTVQCGLLSLMGDKGRTPRRVLIAPVDRPGWTTEHVRSLMQQSATSTLAFQGRAGHPLLLHDPDIAAVLSAPAETPLRDLFKPELVEAAAPHIGLNIDTPADLILLRGLESVLLS
ncbi:MAG: NTP transferase domain-containing protein [Candidatus Poseidoniaceae archaeon]|jgi:molybdenum cofactor cytidylyltransferase|tara:strand:+ start:4765 stop:5445 length:681 start_codon:yes stop_codon:yes gene_type:complete